MILHLKITFYLYACRLNAKGDAPIYSKLTWGNERKEFSTGIYIRPNLWDKDSQRLKGITDEALLLNRKLHDIQSALIRTEKQLYDEQEEISLEAIYSRYRGKTTEHTLSSVFDERIMKMKSLIGIEYTPATFQKFQEVYAHVKRFLPTFNKQHDIPLKQLNYAFIKGYEEYLLGLKLKPITINKIIQRLRQMVIFAVRCGYLDKDPFVEYKPLKEKKQIVFLTEDELRRVENNQFAQKRVEDVKQLYLFSVYTGLAYHEAHSLNQNHIVKGFDGKDWIVITRQKTDKEVSIPLLPQAKAILSYFKESGEDCEGYLLPRITNQKINSYLKEIAEMLGVNKKLTHHTARKTFATTILLNNDVPIEVVSSLLGHSDIAVTQRSYAQVLKRNISQHMSELEEKLK